MAAAARPFDAAVVRATLAKTPTLLTSPAVTAVVVAVVAVVVAAAVAEAVVTSLIV